MTSGLNTQVAWERLRHAAHDPPSTRTWRALLEVLEGWPGDRATALEYAQAHLEGWPAELRVNTFKANAAPWRWGLLRHLNLGWAALQVNASWDPSLMERLSHLECPIEILTVPDHEALEALLQQPGLPRVSDLRLTDRPEALSERDWERLDACLPNLTRLTLVNDLHTERLDLIRRFRHLKHLRLIGLDPLAWDQLALPSDLISLELSAMGESPWEAALRSLEYGLVEHLTLRHVTLDAPTLEVLETYLELKRLDLGQSTLTDGARAWLEASSIPEVVAPETLQAMWPVHDGSLAATIAGHLGSYRGGYETGGGGESETFTLSVGRDGLLRFNLDWSGYWVSGWDADSDLYEVSGTAYPVTGECLLLVPEEEDGHLVHLLEEGLLYAWMRGGGCEVVAPHNPLTRYDGPFGLALRREG